MTSKALENYLKMETNSRWKAFQSTCVNCKGLILHPFGELYIAQQNLIVKTSNTEIRLKEI
ncbi:CLUMA_CG000942, isoform A [Clunio marinus]|uniref:CLUMA_CG000942, isoform A n=1 Tax=Clunio marinus TaxID=568069 RepID=A0A1J1HGK3_9DIPT|nr:CLUMA_CG000942, isoform A [Clunio marinus]